MAPDVTGVGNRRPFESFLAGNPIIKATRNRKRTLYLGPEFPGVTFFEIDHPATATLKAKGIASLGERENLCLIAEDLGKRRLVDVLPEHERWDALAQTGIVAEGLLQYLPSASIRDLFAQCAESTGNRSRIAFTFIDTRKDGRPNAVT